jgi:hypothetical protein
VVPEDFAGNVAGGGRIGPHFLDLGLALIREAFKPVPIPNVVTQVDLYWVSGLTDVLMGPGFGVAADLRRAFSALGRLEHEFFFGRPSRWQQL